ncbi:MAG: 5'/3'-nucleotidase SurE [Nitrososphaerota archaeon]|nr:5'/3'-nucleotidase SurE [Nitrososphaerota archaeon]
MSPGVRALIKALSEAADVTPVLPEEPRSGTSMSLTFHKPVRIRKISVGGKAGYSVSGSPADAVMVALNRIYKEKPPAMASGINIGDNTSLQDIFASGTVQAAVQSAFLGVPAVAFSMQISENVIFSPAEAMGDFTLAAEHAAKVMSWVAEHGLPKGVDILNVNYPMNMTRETKTVYTYLSKKKYDNYIMERMDPRGRPYYWIWGNRAERYPEGSDARAVLEDGLISMTPLSVNMSAPRDGIEGLIKSLS